MKCQIEGEEYHYDGKLSVRDAIFIQEKSGCTVNEIWPALAKADASVIAAWMFLMMRRAGKLVRWEDVLIMDVWTFDVAPDDDEVAKADQASGEPPPDPTRPTGQTQPPDITAT